MLRITDTAFPAYTQQRQEDHNWAVKDEEGAAMLNGNDEQRSSRCCARRRGCQPGMPIQPVPRRQFRASDAVHNDGGDESP